MNHAILAPLILTFSDNNMPEANSARGAADTAINSAKREKTIGDLTIPNTKGQQINRLITRGFFKWDLKFTAFPSRLALTTSRHKVLSVRTRQSIEIAPRIGRVAALSKMKTEIGSTNKT